MKKWLRLRCDCGGFRCAVAGGRGGTCGCRLGTAACTIVAQDVTIKQILDELEPRRPDEDRSAPSGWR